MIEFKDQELYVTGQIRFDNAEVYFKNGLEQIQRMKQQFPLIVNLSHLEHGSTLALAVLVQWVRQVGDSQKLHFKDVPEKMMKIIQACHLQDDLKLI